MINLYFLKSKIKLLLKNKQEVSKFILVGLLSTFLNLLTYSISLKIFNIIFISSINGNVVGLINSFYLSKNWTFKYKKKATRKVLFSFLAIYISGVIFGSLITLISSLLINSYILAWLFGAIFIAFYNYINIKKYTFK